MDGGGWYYYKRNCFFSGVILMRLKDNSIDLNGFKAEMQFAIAILLTVERLLDIEFRVTSVADYKHGRNSEHYKGFALDFGSKEFGLEKAEKILKMIKERINTEYTIILENKGGVREHFHFEYDPIYQPN